MKTIFFDLYFSQPSGGSIFHGGGEYIKSVFHALTASVNNDVSLIVFYNKKAFIDDWIIKIIEEKKIKTIDIQRVEEISAYFKENIHRGAVFFTGMVYGYENVELPGYLNRICVCHGLRGIECTYDREAWRYINNKHDVKEFVVNGIFQKKKKNELIVWFTKLLGKFDIIITDSEHSAYSIALNLHQSNIKNKMKVYYAPEKITEVEVKGRKEKLKCDETDYILMISGNRWLKNCYRGVMAIDNLISKGLISTRTLVFGEYPNRLKKKIRNRKYFSFYGYVSTEELESAYKNCSVFLYPTLNEGFGLPPLEAMKYGKTCVVSGICSLPELYGNAVYYCNPYDVMEIENRILHAIDKKISPEIISTQINLIKKRQTTDLLEICQLIIGM